MSDLIDRQAALDAMKRSMENMPCFLETFWDDAFEYFAGVLEQLPSAQPPCRDCKMWQANEEPESGYCVVMGRYMPGDGFCCFWAEKDGGKA